jgi:hypothetical protein
VLTTVHREACWCCGTEQPAHELVRLQCLLLVAILDEGQGMACQILARRSIDLRELRSALLPG